MHRLSSGLLGQACHIFLEMAYPGGPDAMPAGPRRYFDLPEAEPVTNFLPPAPFAHPMGQKIENADGKLRGFSFRLGSVHYPHLKLRVQLVDRAATDDWIFTVDTHDAYSKDMLQPPADHPDAPGWRVLQQANRELKAKIETAWEAAGLPTFLGQLRDDLERA